MDSTQNSPRNESNFLTPIAREGEPQFACILRNRSGIDSGQIDHGTRSIKGLCPADQQAAINSAFAVYELWCSETGYTAWRDSPSGGGK